MLMLQKLFPLLWIFILTVTVKTSVMESMETIKTQCANEQTMLILVHDEGKLLQPVSEQIAHKMKAEVYDIEKDQVPEASEYDIVILGDVSKDGHLSKEMRAFLGWYDLTGNTVTSYWIGDHSSYETELKQVLGNVEYVSGFENDAKELKDQKDLNARMNGWLTSTCSADKHK